MGKDTKNTNALHKRLQQFSVENLQSMSSHDEEVEIQDNFQFLGNYQLLFMK